MARRIFPLPPGRVWCGDENCIVAHELGVPIYAVRIGLRRGLATIAGMRGIAATWHRCGDYRAGNHRWVVNAHLQICLSGPIGQ
jgi:hypothetical protein